MRAALFLFGVLQPLLIHGVILISTDDPNANTSEPTGSLTGSGWQYLGNWGSFLGTPIAPQFFITAQHIGGKVGDSILFQGRSYTTTRFFDDPNSDLRIWQVCGIFPIFAPLYATSDERGRNFVVFGRGTQRGEAVTVGGTLKGWRWGTYDGRVRWGENQVSELLTASEAGLPPSSSGQLNYFKALFNGNAGPNEAHLSLGDSGGAVFIQRGGWKLAGINLAVEGPFNTVPEGEGFNAALFDKGGLYEKNGTDWMLNQPSLLLSQPSGFIASRISASASWINDVLSSASGDNALVVLQSALSANGPYADEPTAMARPGENAFLVPRPSDARFYRLRSCAPANFVAIQVEADTLVIRYASP